MSAELEDSQQSENLEGLHKVVLHVHCDQRPAAIAMLQNLPGEKVVEEPYAEKRLDHRAGRLRYDPAGDATTPGRER